MGLADGAAEHDAPGQARVAQGQLERHLGAVAVPGHERPVEVESGDQAGQVVGHLVVPEDGRRVVGAAVAPRVGGHHPEAPGQGRHALGPRHLGGGQPAVQQDHRGARSLLPVVDLQVTHPDPVRRRFAGHRATLPIGHPLESVTSV
jgi:hypothetical protein